MSENKSQRKLQWEAFVNDNMQKVAEILIKYDPIGLVFRDDNGKVENQDEYDSEAKELLTNINLYGGMNKIKKEVLQNLLHSCFCQMFCYGNGLIDGSFYLLSIEDVEHTVGTKDRYKEPAEEIWDLLNANN